MDNLGDFSLFELFRSEAETQVAALNEGLVELESNPASPEILQNLMRAAHSLKGAARIVGVHPPVIVAHALEDVFVSAQEGKTTLTPAHFDVLLQSVDFLSSLSNQSESSLNAWLDAQQTTIAELKQKLENLTNPQASPPAHSDGTSQPATPALSPKQLQSTTPDPRFVTKAATTPEADSSPISHLPSPISSQSLGSGSSSSHGSGTERDKAVKVDAIALNRLLALAAESHVETQRLQPFADQLLHLRRQFADLERTFSHQTTTHDNHDFLSIREEFAATISQFDQISRRFSFLSERLYREVMASRMRPFSDGVQGLSRLVRDVSRTLGKKARLEITGQNTKVDRDILDKLEAPLSHILRNALDHGLEAPEDRARAAKPEQGLIRIQARHQAGMLSISIADDGRGIDLEKVRRKAIDKGLVAEEMALRLSSAETLDFLFLPGFSTAKSVTEISGRGVGLDVVRDMLQEVGGDARIQTESGKGTTFHLTLPVARSVLRVLLVEIQGQPYAIPLSRVESIARIEQNACIYAEGKPCIPGKDGSPVSLIPADVVLGLSPQSNPSPFIHYFQLRDGDSIFAIRVQAFLGERSVVVRPLDPRLGKLPGIQAATLLDDGSPAFILDVDDFNHCIRELLATGKMRFAAETSPAQEKPVKRILVTDDSITVREVERSLLENAGYAVEVAVDGIDGWNTLRLGRFDLLVSDIDMPRMNGFELVEKIRADERLKNLPIIIVSYKDREEDRKRGMEAGANRYLTKASFHDERLIEAVTDLIGSPQS